MFFYIKNIYNKIDKNTVEKINVNKFGYNPIERGLDNDATR